MSCQRRGFFTPPNNSFHAIHKVPSGNSPYVTAKHVQLIDKDPSKAISLFWAAINAGDRVDSALKDMAIVMKQIGRSDEAIEAIKSFRHLCSHESQDSLDNLLIDLYKNAGRIEEEIEILKLKVKLVEEGFAYGGKRMKRANSYGKKVQMPVEKEYSRLLGNLAWAYMKKEDFKSAEEHYRKALSFDSNTNKQCNLAMCLMHMNRLAEAKLLLQAVRVSFSGHVEDSQAKSYERASQLLTEFESNNSINCVKQRERGSGIPYERRVNFDWRTNHSQLSIDGEATDYARKRAHDASPYTQPRQRPWSFNSGNNKCMTSAESGAEGVRRKRLFVSSNGADNPSGNRKCGKSWGDVVDEKVEKRITGSDYPGLFNDENMNSNIISETPRPSEEDVEKMNQRMKLLDLESGYCTQPEKIKNQTVRRSLCFDSGPPLPAETLVLEGKSLTESDRFFSSENCMKLTRRLQVFEDITRADRPVNNVQVKLP